MSFLKRLFSSADESAMKTIVYRGGVVTFRVPAHWREEYSDIDGGTFYEDRPDSGTLRLKIITLAAPKELEFGSAMDLLNLVQNGLKDSNVLGTATTRKDGNALFTYEQAGSERGQALRILYWVIANPLPPAHARLITFSYTSLAEKRCQSQIQRDLKMLEMEIEAATFSPVLGVVQSDS